MLWGEAVVFQIEGPSVIMNASLAPAFHWQGIGAINSSKIAFPWSGSHVDERPQASICNSTCWDMYSEQQ